VHIVHHQSEEYNFTVSARITVLQAFLRGGFWCILPLIGFPAPMIAVMLLIHGLYPFFVHTELICKLGVLEYLIVTPSHHRVHHASNDKYLDKNYGDVLIIWDKLFGTFQSEESETPIVYGLTKPLNTYSFLWQHFHYFIEIAIAVSRQKTLRDRIKTIFGRPDTLDPTIRKEAERIFNVKQTNAVIEKPLNLYVKWQIGLLLTALFGFILIEKNVSILFSTVFTLFTILTLINCGAIMEQKKWVFSIEFARAFLLTLIPLYLYNYQTILLISLTAFIVISVRYKKVEKHYLNLVYSGD